MNINYVANFNGVSLGTIPNLQIYAIEDYPPHRTVNIFKQARRSSRKVSSAFYQEKTIFISVYITAPNRASVDQSLDLLFKMLQGVEGSLVIEKAGKVRLYTCTFARMAKNNSGIGRGNTAPPSGGYMDTTLEFETSDSFGYDTDYTKIWDIAANTGASRADAYTQLGGADTQVPFLQAQVNAVTGGTNATITIGNLGTGQAISVTRTYGLVDILQIDSRNKTVQVNGNDVSFTGAFPEFGLGLQNITYTDTFTTRTVKLYGYCYNRYN